MYHGGGGLGGTGWVPYWSWEGGVGIWGWGGVASGFPQLAQNFAHWAFIAPHLEQVVEVDNRAGCF